MASGATTSNMGDWSPEEPCQGTSSTIGGWKCEPFPMSDDACLMLMTLSIMIECISSTGCGSTLPHMRFAGTPISTARIIFKCLVAPLCIVAMFFATIWGDAPSRMSSLFTSSPWPAASPLINQQLFLDCSIVIGSIALAMFSALMVICTLKVTVKCLRY